MDNISNLFTVDKKIYPVLTLPYISRNTLFFSYGNSSNFKNSMLKVHNWNDTLI